MPGNASNNSFGSGFAAGTRLGAVRVGQEQNQINKQALALKQQQNQQEQQQLLRQNFLEGMQKNITDVQKTTASLAPAIQTEKAQGKLDGENTKAYQATVPVILSDMAEVVKAHVDNGVISEGEGALIMRRATMASQLTDPSAQKRLESDIQQEKEIAVAEGVQPLELEKIRARGAEARATAAVPRAERITNMNPDELANPAISTIFGIPNATVDQLSKLNIFIPEDKATIRELIPARRARNEVVSNASRALQIIDRSPDVASLGDAAEFADKIRTVALDLAKNLEMTLNLTPDSAEINDAIKELAGENRELGSIMLSMAYASAIAKGQKGSSLSDKDIVNEIKTIGGDARTQTGRRRALMGFVERAEESYADRIESTLNRRPPKSPYTMNDEELLQLIKQAGGWENLSTEDQAVIRARKEFIEGDLGG